MRFNIKLVYTLIIFSIVLILTFSNGLTLKELDESMTIMPVTDSVRLIVKLYFVDDRKLKVEERYIQFNSANYSEKIADELRNGPKNKMYDDIFDGDVELLSAEVIDGTCYVNLNDAFLKSPYWETESKEYYLWSLVNTFAEIEGVSGVQILVGGKKINAEVGELSLMEPLPRRDEYIYVKKVYPSDTVIQFVDNINKNRFDLAYDLMDSKSKSVMDFKEFTLEMEQYKSSISGYRRKIYFTQSFTESQIIYVKYNRSEYADTSLPSVKYENWEVVQEDGLWKVKLY
ncbi:MAG: GerMN domain-containing protein [Clostridia bacterium]|nr:GerMN domain-containing protein [Clostridia bacterium]